MPALQTTYALTHPAAVEGMQATQEPVNVISRIADAPIGQGKVVVQGATDRSVRLPSGTAATFRGVTLMSHETYPVAGVAPDTYNTGAVMPVMTKGTVWVIASAAVAVGAAAYFDASGNISSVNTGTAIPNAFFDTSTTSAGALAILRLN